MYIDIGANTGTDRQRSRHRYRYIYTNSYKDTGTDVDADTYTCTKKYNWKINHILKENKTIDNHWLVEPWNYNWSKN